MKRLILIVFSALLFAGLLAACSSTDKTGSTQTQTSSGQPDTKAKLVDPATLITQDEAAAVLGEPSKPAEIKTSSVNPMGQKEVVFNPVNDNSYKMLQLSIVQNEGMNKNMTASGYTVKKLYEDTRKGFADAKDVSGVGEQAFMRPSWLHVVKGNTYFVIYINNKATDAQKEEAAKSLASKIINRL